MPVISDVSQHAGPHETGEGASSAASGGAIITLVRGAVAAIRKVSWCLSLASAVLLAVLILLQVYEVVFRNVTGASAIRGMTEYIAVGMVFVVFLSIGQAERLGAHVRTPLVTSRLPQPWGRRVRGVALVVAGLFVWMLVIASINRAFEAMHAGETFSGIANVSTWQARFAVPIGAFLLGLELIARGVSLDGVDQADDVVDLAEGNVL